MKGLKLLLAAVAFLSASPAWPSPTFNPWPNYGDGHWKAPVATSAALPASGNFPGDTRVVLSPASIYQWDGSAWSTVIPPNVVHSGGTSTDKALARWNGTAGSTLQDSSGTTLSDLGLLTTPNLVLSSLTPSTVPYLDASKQLQSSSVTPTTLGYLDATSSIQTQIDGKQSSTLTNGDILVGNASNLASAVAPGGDVSMTNAGVFTVGTVGGSTAANIHTAEGLANAATNLNTVSTIVKRDGSGNFSAGTITAALSGNASTASALAANPTDCGANQFASSIDAAGNLTCSTIPNAATTATNLNTASAIVARDASGNFSAGVITASLTGAVTGHASSDLQASNNLSDVANKTTAMNNLKPTTTKGDLIVDDGTNATRFAVCPDGQAPIADSTQTTGWKCGATGSGSGINYIDNGTFESSTSGWTTYADGAASPVDGTGGSPTLTIARSTTSPLRGTASGLITAGGLGDGAAYDFTIDAADEGHQESIQFDYVTASGTIADGDYTVWIYDVTNAVLIQPVPYQIYAAPSVPGHWSGTFQAASNSTSYRLLVHQAVASTGDMRVDTVTFGPQITTQGPPVTDWQSYTTTVSPISGFSSGPTAFYRRVGDTLEIQAHFQKDTNAGTGASTLTFTIPSGLAIDTSKTVNNADGAFGSALEYNTTLAGAYDRGIIVGVGSTTTLYFRKAGSASSLLGTDVGANASFSLYARVPISGWSSGLTMSSAVGNTTVVAYDSGRQQPTGTLSAAYNVVKFGTVDRDTTASYSTSTGQWTAPTSRWCTFSTNLDVAHVSVSPGNALSARIYDVTQAKSIAQTFVSTGSTSVGELNASISGSFYVQSGDLVEVESWDNGTTPSFSMSQGGSFFSIKCDASSQQLAASDTVAARYYSASNPTITTTPTIINFDQKTHDYTGAVTTGASWKFSPGVSGLYRACIRLLSSTTTVASSFQADLYKSGSYYSTPAYGGKETTSSGRYALNGCDDVRITGTDYLDFRAEVGTGSVALSGDSGHNFVSITRIGN